MKLNMSEDKLRELTKIEDESDCTCCNPDAFETCIVCGKLTMVPKHLNVELRDFYVEGAGQVCKECFKTL